MHNITVGMLHLKRYIEHSFQSISPGSVDTNIFKTAQFRPSSQIVGQTVTSRPVLKPEDVAAAIITVLETPPHVEVSQSTCLYNIGYILILIFM